MIKDKVKDESTTEQSRSDSKGPDIYGGNVTKAATNSQPPKSSEITTDSSITNPNATMHPPVDYQQTPTHPHGTMTSVPIPFQPIHDYTGTE